jgi:hypothetical protein
MVDYVKHCTSTFFLKKLKYSLDAKTTQMQMYKEAVVHNACEKSNFIICCKYVTIPTIIWKPFKVIITCLIFLNFHVALNFRLPLPKKSSTIGGMLLLVCYCYHNEAPFFSK